MKAYFLWISTRDGTLSQKAYHFLERKIPEAELFITSLKERYARFPELPLAVCKKAEYSLFTPNDLLLYVGCVDGEQDSSTVWGVRRVIAEYERLIREGKNTTALMQPKKALPRRYR